MGLAMAQEQVFRVNVQLVRLLATVKDVSGQPVGDLKQESFSVYDNGVKQELKVFEHHTSQPLSITLMVDTSGSTAKDLKYETDSVNRFVRVLIHEGNPDDALSLYSFNWEIRQHVPFTRSTERVTRALKLLKAEAGTSMYDAIYFGSQDLETREGRHVVLVVTDGGDTISTKTYHEALAALHRADAVFYAILVMPITNDPGRNIGGENALTTLAAGTGGKVFLPSIGAGMDAAFDEILRDLRTQYLLAYYPKDVPPSPNRFHRIEIKTDRSDLRVISRTGYYGDEDRTKPSNYGRGPNLIRR
jgi:Ca-activated chloride channel family protein